jgi:hypothetical protein
MTVAIYKSPELCFLEIANEVIKTKNRHVDTVSNIRQWDYAKMRNYNKPYIYEGDIQVSKDVTLRFYFSHIRSCISLESQNVETVDLQYNLKKYIQTFFYDHKIDAFINGLQE